MTATYVYIYIFFLLCKEFSRENFARILGYASGHSWFTSPSSLLRCILFRNGRH